MQPAETLGEFRYRMLANRLSEFCNKLGELENLLRSIRKALM